MKNIINKFPSINQIINYIIKILSQLYTLIINLQLIMYLPLLIIAIGIFNQFISELSLYEILNNPLHYSTNMTQDAQDLTDYTRALERELNITY